MGRTIPSFRLATSVEKEEWKDSATDSVNLIGNYLIECFQLVICIVRLVSMLRSPIRIQPILMSIIFHHYEILKRLAANDIGMTDKDIGSQRKAKAEEHKEEVIKAQTPGPKTAEVFKREASDKKAKNTDI